MLTYFAIALFIITIPIVIIANILIRQSTREHVNMLYNEYNMNTKTISVFLRIPEKHIKKFISNKGNSNAKRTM